MGLDKAIELKLKAMYKEVAASKKEVTTLKRALRVANGTIYANKDKGKEEKLLIAEQAYTITTLKREVKAQNHRLKVVEKELKDLHEYIRVINTTDENGKYIAPEYLSLGKHPKNIIKRFLKKYNLD